MEQNHVVRETTHVVYMALDHATPDDALQSSYGSDSYFTPKFLRMRWAFSAKDGLWHLAACETSGNVLKKNGQVGVRFARRDFESNGELEDGTPDWLRGLVELYRPAGLVLVP